MKPLKGSEIERVVEALVHGYHDWDALKSLVLYALDLRLAVKIGGADLPLETLAQRLFAYTEARGITETLLREAVARNPGNPTLKLLAHDFGLAPAASVVLARHGYEARVLMDSHLESIGLWHLKMAECERRVCQILFKGEAIGTGVLVAPDLVLSNWHVFEMPQGGGELGVLENFAARFDYRASADGTIADPGVIVPLRAEQVQKPAAASPKEALDFALVRLATPTDAARGHTKLGTREPQTGEALIVLQHPARRSLEIAVGSMLGWLPGAEGRTCQHNAETDEGSSGSPCFAADWTLLALHHRAAPDGQGPNRAIATTAILSRLGANNEIGLLPAV